MTDAERSSGWAIDSDDGGLVSDEDAARERRALIWAYIGAWLFAAVINTVYVAAYSDFTLPYWISIAGVALGLAFGRVIFDPRASRSWILLLIAWGSGILLVLGRHIDQPGTNAFLLIGVVFGAFFLWRDRRLYWAASVLLIAAYCALPIMIGGWDELRRTVIGGPIFALIAYLSYVFVRRAGRLQLERSTFHTTVSSLLTALNSRDGDTKDHALQTVRVVEAVALELGLSDADREKARYAAYLHDIGKIGVPNELLDRSGPLTTEEWEVLRQHPQIGERIVASVPGFSDVAAIVRSEHESWNGSGYPDGLSGDRIPIESRILHACDFYTALVASQPHGDGADSAVMQAMQARSGTQFDPEVVAALMLAISGEGELRASRVVDLSLRLAS